MRWILDFIRLRFGLFKRLVAACLILGSAATQAHLLNMTEVEVEISAEPNQSYAVTFDLEMDLLAELGSAEAYYKFSQLTSEQILSQHAEILQRLASSIHIQQQSGSTTPEVIQILPAADTSLSDFQNNFVWPMTGMQLRAELTSSEPIRIQFQTGFIFEEPIALSMHSTLINKRKSRWLVAGQTSPIFAWASETNGVGKQREQIASEFGEPKSISIDALWSYMLFGFLHILPYGWDHLLFVLMMYLSVAGLKPLVVRISLFTLAHSITLGMASYRIVEMSALLTEVLISLSILAVALLNLKNKPSPQLTSNPTLQDSSNISGHALIFTFGMLHGLGFASSLNNLGQPMEHFLLSLLSFNIGVELGQLTFLACLGLSIGWFKHKLFWYSRIVKPLSVLTGGIIILWIARILA